MAAAATGGTVTGGPTTGQAGGGTSIGKKKDGGPSAKFWESSDTVFQMDAVRQWIMKHYKKVSASS